MQDLIYIINLGFSGSDIGRAVIITFFLAMFVGKKRPPALMALWALLIDRVIWPLSALWFDGVDNEIMSGVINGMMQSFGDDLGLFMVRYAGLMVMILIFASLRKRLHTPKFDKHKHQSKPKPVYG